ncbi:MAG TPA: hypothetical protein DCZ72_03845, partial [Armatimonadetes bacterium]|nr:hypothetical protein [Armatimonadota bacterium]
AGTGLAGWVPLVEVIEATQALRDALGRAAPAEVLDELAYSPQLPALREQAAAAVRRGLCTPEGAYRALVTY